MNNQARKLNVLKVREVMKRKLKIRTICIQCILGAVLILLPLNAFSSKALVGRRATNFILKDLNGKELALKDFRGKIVILVFGELYQENTLKAVQDLKKILSEKKSYQKSVEVLLIVSEDKKPGKYLKVKGGLEIPYTILLDDQRKAYAQYEIIALPTTFIVDRSGKIMAGLPSYTISYYDQVDVEVGFLLGEIKKEELDSVFNPKAMTPRMNGKSERLLALAENLKNRGFYDSALNSYKKVLERDPTVTEAQLGMGVIYLEKGELDKAEGEFQKILQKNPDDLAAIKGMAQVYLGKGNIEKAEELLTKVISSNYVDEDIFYVMGELYEKKGDLKQALEYYKRNSQKLLRKRWLK
jgi:tetratricopeptide (TPR) repeat protein